jgi:hypothetical protein
VKLGLGVLATIALLIHQWGPVTDAARHVSSASADTLFSPAFGPLKIELVRAPALAIVLLLAAVMLAFYKPWGLTRYGRRRLEQQGAVTPRPAQAVAPRV